MEAPLSQLHVQPNDSSSDAAALATLIRMFEAGETAGNSGSLDERDAEQLAKAYAIVSSMDQADGGHLKAVLSQWLHAETAVGRSTYSTQHSFHSLVQAIFWALRAPVDTQQREKLRALVFVIVLKLLHATNSSSVAQRLVLVLLQELHNLRVTDLASAVSEVLRGVTHSQRSQHRGDALAVFYTIELLPQLLLRVSSSMMLSFEVSQSDSCMDDLSGPAYRQHVVAKLAGLAWPRRFFLQVLKSFRDFTLSQDEERLFCIKIYREARKELSTACDQARALEIFPAVCLNVLQLVGRTENTLCRRLLTRLLINKCQQLTTVAPERTGGGISSMNAGTADLTERELRALQSTVLFHVEVAMRQWERLGKAMMVEYEQRSPTKLSSFDIALLLLVASQKKYEQVAMQHLLRYVVDTYKSQRIRSGDGGQEVISRKALLSVVQHAHDGSWTSVVHQMIELSFRLVEYKGLKGDTSDNTMASSAAPEWVDFGVRLLLACFMNHASSREKVLDRIVNMVIVQNADCATYIHIISRIVKRHFADLTGRLELRIRECLEYVTHMHPDHANNLLLALSPLLKSQHNLKSFVILMLRKAMFRKDEHSRIIAIQGFALLLCLSARIFSRNRTLSQLYSQNVTMLSQGGHGGSSSMHHLSSALDVDLASQEQAHALVAEDLYRQFCGIFRRALHLQTRVRLVLYAELIKVFTECPALRQPILALLFDHYIKYYDFNESVQPPLKIDLSLARKRGVYEEPLPYLLHTMLHCFEEIKKDESEHGDEEDTMMDDIPATQAGGATQVTDSMDQNVSILFERMKRCELSDFEFDKNSSFSEDSELGETNRRLGHSVMGIVQVAMNWSLSRRQRVTESGDETERDNLIQPIVWETLLHYAQIHTWIERRLASGDGTASKPLKKKRKLEKGTTAKQDLTKLAGPVATDTIADIHDADGWFENHASLNWATLVAPASLLQILEFAATKMRPSDGGRPSLSVDEEDFVVLIADKSIKTLDLMHKKRTQDGGGSKYNDVRQQYQKQRRSHDGSAAYTDQLDQTRFTRRLCDVLLVVLHSYCCNEEVSLAMPTGTGSRKTRNSASAADTQAVGRMRRLVELAVDGVVGIVGMWSRQPFDEFEEQMVRAFWVNRSRGDHQDDHESPDYDLGGDVNEGLSLVLPPLQKLIDDLIAHEMADKANSLVDVVQIVVNRMSQASPSSSSSSAAAASASASPEIPSALKQNAAWVKEIVVSRPGHVSPRLLEKLVALLLRPHSRSPLQCVMAQQLAQGLRCFCTNANDDEDDAQEPVATPAGTPPPIKFRRLNDKQVITVASTILAKIDDAFAETELQIKAYDSDQRRHALKFKEDDLRALQQLEEQTGSQVFGEEGVNSRGVSSSFAVYKRLCTQLHELTGVLRPFVPMDLNNTTVTTRILRLVGRLYKLLVLLVKDKLRRKDMSLPRFVRNLLDRTAKELSPVVLEFISCLHGKSHKQRGTKSKSKSAESKFIPDVIYQLEQYDLVLIKLSKMCKGHDFSTWCKLRPSHDFRLNPAQVKKSFDDAGIKKKDEEEEQEAVGSDQEDDDDEEEAENGAQLTSEETVTDVLSGATGEEEDEEDEHDDEEQDGHEEEEGDETVSDGDDNDTQSPDDDETASEAPRRGKKRRKRR